MEFREHVEARSGMGCLTPQVLHEFYAVITDPRRVGRAVGSAEAVSEIEVYLRGTYRMMFPGPTTHLRALSLARQAGVLGQHFYDCVLAATALDNGVSVVYTADTHGFKFPGLRAVNPLRRG